MKTKVFIVAAIFCTTLFSTIALLAQKQKTIEELAKSSIEQLDSKIDLSDDQEKKAYEITLKYMKKTQILKNSSASRTDKYKAYKIDNEAKKSEMNKILSSEQFKEWEKIDKELKDEMKKAAKNNKK